MLRTLLSDDENEFWLQAIARSLDAVWNNAEDDVYVQLLQSDLKPLNATIDHGQRDHPQP